MSARKNYAPRSAARSSNNPLLAAALQYARQGWAVFPLAPRSKVPFKGSHGYKDATTDPATIHQWWAAHPDANIGIATGEVSDLTIIDIDPRNGGDVTLKDLTAENGPLPPTATVRTGSRGLQFYFTHAFTAAKSSDALGPGIDLKGNGGYVVAPPSVHPNGTAYVWETDGHQIAELPPWVVTMEGPSKDGGGGHRTRRSTSSCTIPPEHLFRGEKPDAECASALGLPLDRKFSCVLHPPDEHPSAWLFVGRGGDVLYRCEHEGGWTLTLPQVLTSLAYGEVTRIRDENGKAQSIEHLAWRLRLLHEAGAIEPAAVRHRTLPLDVRDTVKAVYEGFLLLLNLKWLIWPNNGTTFSWRFTAAWCGMDKKTAEKAMRRLMEQGYVRSVGTSRSAYGKMAHVLMPSSEKPEKYARRPRKEWAIFRREQRDAEAIARYEDEQAEQSGELLEAIAEYEYEQSEARGDHDNLDLWEPGDPEPDFEPELMDDEPLDPKILATIDAAEGEVIM